MVTQTQTCISRLQGICVGIDPLYDREGHVSGECMQCGRLTTPRGACQQEHGVAGALGGEW